MVVTDFLMENFSRVVDYNFTADVEERFDKVAEGEACLLYTSRCV